ncbi:MAG TPA: hypothetical protein VFM83_12970 [Gaiellaceae bacterium]|nr:hypothetical protein [Gaiellaceae bacterium]
MSQEDLEWSEEGRREEELPDDERVPSEVELPEEEHAPEERPTDPPVGPPLVP